jgi:aldose sugar dehydrogenase
MITKGSGAVTGLVFALASAASAQTTAPTERELAERTLWMYLDGWATNDSVLLNRAMHSSTYLKRSADGKIVLMSKQEYVGTGRSVRPRDSTLSTRIVSLDIVGRIASARTEISIGTNTFVDFFNLLRDDTGWYIVDKIAVPVPRGTAPGVMPRPTKEVVIDGLKRPWGMVFLSPQEVLISEKEGDLVRVDLSTKVRTKIAGFPSDMADSVGAFGFGDNTGKFDVVLDPEFGTNRRLFVSYAARSGRGRTTKVISARLRADSLSDIRTIFVAEPYTAERVHYGGGLVFGPDGKLYLTVGERLFNERDEPAWPFAQDRADRRGKIYRFNPDGSIPSDNPNWGRGAVDGLFALGIRASQGLAVQPTTNAIWFSDHGTNQGDELNVLRAGANYGWPLRTTGRYRDTTYAPPAPRDSLVPPVWSWPHTVAPTALHFYTGHDFPTWRNSLLVGGLSRGSLWRMTIDGTTVVSAEELFVNDRERLRDIIQSPTGELYLLTDDNNGKLVRVRNAPTAATPGR